MQDEPGAGDGFSYEVSLEERSRMQGPDHQRANIGTIEPGVIQAFLEVSGEVGFLGNKGGRRYTAVRPPGWGRDSGTENQCEGTAADSTLSSDFLAGRWDFKGVGFLSHVPRYCAKLSSAAMAWSILSRSAYNCRKISLMFMGKAVQFAMPIGRTPTSEACPLCDTGDRPSAA